MMKPRCDVTEFDDEIKDSNNILVSFSCRSISIGSYQFHSDEKVVLTPKGIQISAPGRDGLVKLNIQKSEIMKCLTHFSDDLNIIFLYCMPSCGIYVNNSLKVKDGDDQSAYFAPVSRDQTKKKIVLLPEAVTEEMKLIIKQIFSISHEGIRAEEANLFVRSSGVSLSFKTPVNSPSKDESPTKPSPADVSTNLIIYPQGRGGIPVTVHDYLTLATDEFVNDVIIDFFLKYVHNELASEEQRDKSHIFSTFFYKNLMRASEDKSKNIRQSRHSHVATWTKSVNIFEKDFIIIPINEKAHWYVVVICFANLAETDATDLYQPIRITSNDAEMEDVSVLDKGQPVKVPCILIFDSLESGRRVRVVDSLRQYLSQEYKSKYPELPAREFNRFVIPASTVKVPQQQNYVDCGLFVLQYIEHFFTDPIENFRLPIKNLLYWFHQDLVTRKREEIAMLIQSLMKNSSNHVELPEVEFPTKDGKILAVPEEAAKSRNKRSKKIASDDDDDSD